jgi:phosphoribosylglycinamide formyltransferase-1
MMRVGVLASGSGSNFEALVAGLRGDQSASVEALLCNVPGAPALERATRLGVPAVLMHHTQWPSRQAYDEALVAELRLRGVELVCLAGYMRLVTPGFLRAFPGRVINVHPALLPSFPGLHAQRQALEAGVRLAGCSVHFVDEGTDTGPIIAQASVPVLPGDDEAALSARIQVQEHRLFPLVVGALGRGEVRLEGRKVWLKEWIG